MPVNMKMTVKGLKELEKKFKDTPEKIENKIFHSRNQKDT